MSDISSLPGSSELKKLPPDGGQQYNRLVFANSPYLLQHAKNPVDWYEWSDEAFEKAKTEDKPVFLSIGYSTCHWCHVMAHESFEDKEVADLINQFTIPIKVDREERPDIDQIYMTVCQAMTGHGGWPLSVFLTPEKNAFFATTYIPKDNKHGRMGMKELLPNLAYSWKAEREKINSSIKSILDFFKDRKESEKEKAEKVLIEKCFNSLSRTYDHQYGGFSDSPKFPSPHNLLFLINYFKISKNENALKMVEKTLLEMRKGGIYDQIGFGFHRYSTDKYWLVPHFEKMLYDQAMLMISYSELYNVTKDERYKIVYYEILEYLNRDMQSENGLYFSAEDADSEGEEGLFYTWETTEILDGIDNPKKFLNDYNFEEEGNYLEEHSHTKNKRNIPYLKEDFFIKVKDELKKDLEKLLALRSKRIRPHLDDKILLDWNSLLLVSLSIGAQHFSDKVLLKKAIDLESALFRYFYKNGQLYHRYRNGNTAIEAMLDDYSFLIWGEIELFKSSHDISFLKKAVDLHKSLLESFYDKKSGFYYFVSNKSERVLNERQKEFYDGAIPSGNSVMFYNLVQLYQLSNKKEYRDHIELILNQLPIEFHRYPSGFSMFMNAYLNYINPKKHLIVIYRDKVLIERVTKLIKDDTIVIFLSVNQNDIKSFTFLNSFPRDREAYYICENFVCNKPVYSFEEFKKIILT